MVYGTRIRSEMDTSRDVEPWGWESFFTELARFIQLSERQYNDHANEQYAEYAMDRLTVASRNIAVITSRDAQRKARYSDRAYPYVCLFVTSRGRSIAR